MQTSLRSWTSVSWLLSGSSPPAMLSSNAPPTLTTSTWRRPATWPRERRGGNIYVCDCRFVYSKATHPPLEFYCEHTAKMSFPTTLLVFCYHTSAIRKYVYHLNIMWFLTLTSMTVKESKDYSSQHNRNYIEEKNYNRLETRMKALIPYWFIC